MKLLSESIKEDRNKREKLGQKSKINDQLERLSFWFMQNINPFLANVTILYPLKTPENQRFPDVFRGYKMGALARYGLYNI